MSTTAELTEQGHAKYRTGDYLEALEIYFKALQIANLPSHLIALHSNRAACFLKLRDFPKAVEECSAVLQQDPNHVGILLLRAQTLQMMEDFQSSLFDVNRLLEIQPKHSSYLKMKAKLKSQIAKRAPPPILESDGEITSETTSEHPESPLDKKKKDGPKPINHVTESPPSVAAPLPTNLHPKSTSDPSTSPILTAGEQFQESDAKTKIVDLSVNKLAEKIKTVFKNEILPESNPPSTQPSHDDSLKHGEEADECVYKIVVTESPASKAGDPSPNSLGDEPIKSDSVTEHEIVPHEVEEEKKVEVKTSSEKSRSADHAKSSASKKHLSPSKPSGVEGHKEKKEEKVKHVKKSNSKDKEHVGSKSKNKHAKSPGSVKTKIAEGEEKSPQKSVADSPEKKDKALVIVKSDDFNVLSQIPSNQVKPSMLDYSKWDQLYVSSDEEEEEVRSKTLYKIKPLSY